MRLDAAYVETISEGRDRYHDQQDLGVDAIEMVHVAKMMQMIQWGCLVACILILAHIAWMSKDEPPGGSYMS